MNHLEQIKKKLGEQTGANALSDWQVRESRTTSDQIFLTETDRECTRSVDTTLFDVNLYSRRKEKGDVVLGTSGFVIGPLEINQLDAMIEKSRFAAGLVTNKVFDLPEAGGTYPDVKMDDASMNAAALEELESRLRSSIEKEKNIRLASAEFFLDRTQTHLINARGLDAAQVGTKVEGEIILAAQVDGVEREFISRPRRRMLADFNVEKEVADAARWAVEATQAKMPKTGTFPVVFSEEPLDRLFEPLVARASGRLIFNRMIQSKVGDFITGRVPPEKDTITLWSNGLLDGGIGTMRFDGFGTPMIKVPLIENGQVKTILANKQYADYLGLVPTGDMGNVQLLAGTTPMSELLNPTFEAEGTIYHIQAFSAFEPNPITGAFSAEIRAGYEISASGIRPIKGGSVSGILSEALRQCRLSSEITQRERYWGPSGIRFNRLTLAGE